MPLADPSQVVDRLRQFQRKVRDAVIKSRTAGDPAAVSRTAAADTIYAIDAAVEPILDTFCEEWGRETPLVLVAEGLEDAAGNEAAVVYPRGTSADRARIRVIVDPIDGTRGLMYDKRAAWVTGRRVAPNRGPNTRLRDIEVAVMTELPTSKMAFGDVLWAVKGQGARAVRERLEEKRALAEPAVHAGRADAPAGRPCADQDGQGAGHGRARRPQRPAAGGGADRRHPRRPGAGVGRGRDDRPGVPEGRGAGPRSRRDVGHHRRAAAAAAEPGRHDRPRVRHGQPTSSPAPRNWPAG